MRKSYDFTILTSGGWIIFCAGRRNGPYPTRMAAIMVAKTAAMRAVAAGCKAKVIERSDTGEVRTLWSEIPRINARF